MEKLKLAAILESIAVQVEADLGRRWYPATQPWITLTEKEKMKLIALREGAKALRILDNMTNNGVHINA